MASLIVGSDFGTYVAVVLWGIFGLIVFLAWRLPKNKRLKIALPLLIAVSFLSWFGWSEHSYQQRSAKERAAYMAKYEPAKAIFDKLCAEQSQPIIKRTVEDVEGVLLLKVRNPVGYITDQEKNRPDWSEAALPGFGREQDRGNEGYAESLLVDWHWRETNVGDPPVAVRTWNRLWSVGGQLYQGGSAKLNESRMKRAFQGFRYVDVLGNDGASRTRYTVRADSSKTTQPFPGLVFTAERTGKPAPRYAVTFEDNLDPDLRKHWIAGTTVMVVDTQSNELIGKRTFWKLDTGFGATGQFGPWSTNARTCVPVTGTEPSIAMSFIYNVLKPRQGE
jgi:hypothetical protein